MPVFEFSRQWAQQWPDRGWLTLAAFAAFSVTVSTTVTVTITLRSHFGSSHLGPSYFGPMALVVDMDLDHNLNEEVSRWQTLGFIFRAFFPPLVKVKFESGETQNGRLIFFNPTFSSCGVAVREDDANNGCIILFIMSFISPFSQVMFV